MCAQHKVCYCGCEPSNNSATTTSATIPKFNRMGVVAGFESKRVRLIRKGFVTGAIGDVRLLWGSSIRLGSRIAGAGASASQDTFAR